MTCRSYGYGMLRWFRLLWLLDTEWERATESEVAVLTGWLRSAANPQRQRHRANAQVAGTANLRTGKTCLCAGYAPRTINRALTVIGGFYEFHAHQGRGPVVNPVPHSAQRRRVLGHRSPLELTPVAGRARLRQRVPGRPPRSIPDRLWDELFTAMNCDRDRALLEISVSSSARAEELLGITADDIDWSGQRIYVITKGVDSAGVLRRLALSGESWRVGRAASTDSPHGRSAAAFALRCRTVHGTAHAGVSPRLPGR